MTCENDNPELNPYSGYDQIHRSMGECFNPNLSIFIPFVYKNTNTKNFIKNTFYDKEIGLVYYIDLIKKQNNKWCAFVYIKWYNNEYTRDIQNELIGNDSKYVFNYTKENYWIFLKNKNPKTKEEMINYEEYVLQKKNIKLNNEYLNKMNYYSQIAQQNINVINCENRQYMYSIVFDLCWDQYNLQYIPLINIKKNH
tara:strand:+ start:899 stop:1489 length:591 start_codon:yes stop_codon:yes gene_type:complete